MAGIIVMLGFLFFSGRLNRENSESSIIVNNGDTKEIYTELNKKGLLSSFLFGGNKIDLSYSKTRPNGVLARFNMDPGENWQGNGFWDRGNVLEGESSLGIISRNHEVASAYYEFGKATDFSKVKFLDFYLKINDIGARESFAVKLADQDAKNFYFYNVTNITQKDWNFVRIPIDQFYIEGLDKSFNLSKVKKVVLEIVSRPDTFILVNIDQLLIENDDTFLEDWNTVNSSEVALDKKDDKVHLLVRSIASNDVVTLSSLPGVKDFSYSFKISPQTSTRMGMIFRGDFKNGFGYYFMIEGADSNSWELKKMSREESKWVDLIKGDIANNTFKKENFYWLKVDVNKDVITLYVSLDGSNYEKLASVKDGEYLKGGIGVAVWDRGYGFFDDFKYEAK